MRPPDLRFVLLRMRRANLDAHALQCMGVAAAIVFCSIGLTGCEPYRIEYVDVPEFYHYGVEGGMPDRVVLPDGTVRIYRSKKTGLPYASEDEEQNKFELRQALPDGSVRLRAKVPEHVVAHLVTCLQREEYELLYDQMLAQPTRFAYEDEGGLEQFEDYMRRNRRDLLVTANRMQHGMAGRDAVLERMPDGAIRCRLRTHLARDFRFTALDMLYEQGQLRLLAVR